MGQMRSTAGCRVLGTRGRSAFFRRDDDSMLWISPFTWPRLSVSLDFGSETSVLLGECTNEGQAEFLRKLLASDLGPGARTHFPELAALDEKPVVVVEVEPTTDEAVYQCQLATERRLVKEKDARKQTAEQVRVQGMLDKQKERAKASAVALLAATEECERYLALVHKAAPKPQVRATKEDPFKLDLSLYDFEIDTEGVPETFKEQLIVAKAKANELFAEHQLAPLLHLHGEHI